ncbi:MAG: pacearchaeosortase [archaeon]
MRYTYNLITRVVLAILLLIVPTGILGINLYQYIFENLTLQTTYALLKLARLEVVIGSYGVKHAIDMFGEYTLNIVKYCVTASAYYLYTLLVILVYDVSILKRIKLILLGYLAIFAMNIARILILVVILVEKGPENFQLAHDLFGTILAVFYVIIIWILFSIAMGIKNIPIITDFKILIGEIMNNNQQK